MLNSTPPTWQKKLGEQLRTARLSKNYPQKKLAELLDLDPETVRLYERGKVAVPLLALQLIVQELRCTFSIDGMVISPSSLPPFQPRVVAEQGSFDFQGSCTYIGANVRVSVWKEGFEVTGDIRSKAANE